MAARKSAEDVMSRPSMRQITSPGSRPASFAGVALPPGVSTSARSATSMPAVVIWMPTARPSGTSDAACADTPAHSASATAAVTAKRRKKCGCFRKKSPLCACSISMPGFGQNSGGTFLLDCLPGRKCLRRRAYDVSNQFW